MVLLFCKIKDMTRSELIARLAERFPQLILKDADACVAEILTAIGDSLKAGNRVEIRGFGSFSLNYRPARMARNPKTGEKVAVSGSSFRTSRQVRS